MKRTVLELIVMALIFSVLLGVALVLGLILT